MPFLTASTPAINVVATAPRPGIRIPNLPVASFNAISKFFYDGLISGRPNGPDRRCSVELPKLWNKQICSRFVRSRRRLPLSRRWLPLSHRWLYRDPPVAGDIRPLAGDASPYYCLGVVIEGDGRTDVIRDAVE